MDIFTAIIGQDISGIDNSVSGTSEDNVKERARDLSGDDQSIGIMQTSIPDPEPTTDNLNFCGHENWKLVDHAYNGLVFRCLDCRTWIFFSPVKQSLKIIDLNSEECPECGSKFVPKKINIFQCKDCRGIIKDGNFVSPDVAKELRDSLE